MRAKEEQKEERSEILEKREERDKSDGDSQPAYSSSQREKEWMSVIFCFPKCPRTVPALTSFNPSISISFGRIQLKRRVGPK